MNEQDLHKHVFRGIIKAILKDSCMIPKFRWPNRKEEPLFQDSAPDVFSAIVDMKTSKTSEFINYSGKTLVMFKLEDNKFTVMLSGPSGNEYQTDIGIEDPNLIKNMRNWISRIYEKYITSTINSIPSAKIRDEFHEAWKNLDTIKHPI